MKKFLSFILYSVIIPGCSHTPDRETPIQTLSFSQLHWERLNPARGDQSPQMARLWGDPRGWVPSGFLVQFVDGFSSPPHIHNVSYKGIVLDGFVHNDPPRVAPLWMPKSSYWTQPAGQVHITSAQGKRNIVLVEIDGGPYRVQPQSQAFDRGERPLNIHASKIIWQDVGSCQKVDLWKNKKGQVTGSMVKFKHKLKLDVEEAQWVIIEGEVRFQNKNFSGGSLLEVHKRSHLEIHCGSENRCIIYVKSEKKWSPECH